MLNVLLGAAVFGATAVAFRYALPVDGKIQRWMTPNVEPYMAIAFVGGASLGLGLMIVGAVTMLR